MNWRYPFRRLSLHWNNFKREMLGVFFVMAVVVFTVVVFVLSQLLITQIF